MVSVVIVEEILPVSAYSDKWSQSLDCSGIDTSVDAPAFYSMIGNLLIKNGTSVDVNNTFDSITNYKAYLQCIGQDFAFYIPF
jgi:hypothetical protein